jgi:hypothetical protein
MTYLNILQNAVTKHSAGRPFWESTEDIDVAIFADALVMLWRFLPEVESIELFRSCLLPERSDAVKLCAITAMHTLAHDVSDGVTSYLRKSAERSTSGTAAPRSADSIRVVA